MGGSRAIATPSAELESTPNPEISESTCHSRPAAPEGARPCCAGRGESRPCSAVVSGVRSPAVLCPWSTCDARAARERRSGGAPAAGVGVGRPLRRCRRLPLMFHARLVALRGAGSPGWSARLSEAISWVVAASWAASMTSMGCGDPIFGNLTGCGVVAIPSAIP